MTRALSERHYRQTEAWMQHHEQRLMQHLAELAPEHDLSESTQQRVRARLVDLWWLAAELKESVATGDLTQEESHAPIPRGGPGGPGRGRCPVGAGGGGGVEGCDVRSGVAAPGGDFARVGHTPARRSHSLDAP